ncbi:UTP--glucose-1-phosphate uridylyltransferase 3 [Citrus sinensis]|uniref:UTP--glucose-1-phosphate uridylyltransferase 3 n=1 Tax=Citrus sinensis TaxID=2711 RepID=A0ACB8L1Q9_CITSI|nr:UTP--glucose-1-phosphate uridylyltransferase 3 [Citrus sinensis]
MSSTTPILHQNNHHQHRLLFSFTSKTTPFHSLHSLHFKRKPLLSFSSSYSASSSSQQHQSITRVSTAPVEYAPPPPDFNFHQEISRLKKLRSRLAVSQSLSHKLSVLDSDSRLKNFFNDKHSNYFARVLASLNLDQLFLIKCVIAAGQEHVLNLEPEYVESEARSDIKSALYALVEFIDRLDVNGRNSEAKDAVLEIEQVKDLNKLLKTLAEIEQFYDCVGGIIGYQVEVLELLAQSKFERKTTKSQHVHESMECQFLEIHVPSGLDLSQNTEYAAQAALWGIEGLPELGEIYPLGGSADRLGLVDHETGECLPAAMLPYCGRTLLEGLIRDLQCITPVAIMTSSAKNNHERITSLCERLRWFGRGQSSFQLFEQPLVPAVDAEDGQWLVMRPFAPVCKPGGHGAIWKLAHDKGIFKWFHDNGRKGATVRQVSNVVAATDLTLLALAGIGLHHGKKLGFASCKRSSGATEGINVLIEKKNLDGKWAYGLSCIEYTEFDKFGITRGPFSSNGLQADFPANTNILYVDLASAELVGSSENERSLPGMVLNTKKPIVYMDNFGDTHSKCLCLFACSVPGGRLECTMQNIADNFLNTYSSRCYKGVEDDLDTFMVYNERRRVTSSAKKKRKHADMSLHQCFNVRNCCNGTAGKSYDSNTFTRCVHQRTPEGSFLDILRNAYDILSQCDIKLPEIEGNDKYIDDGPPYLILLHPALGLLWEVTRQKFKGGSVSKGSELQIEVAEFLWRNVQLDGSLIIVAENVMGSTRIADNGESILQYGHRCGRCKLNNVKVLNKGIDWDCGDNTYWKHDVQWFEALKVILHGNAEFEASDVTLQGNHVFEVPDGHKLKITSGNSGLVVQLDPIEQNMMDTGSWHWNYKINGSHIVLELVEL